MVMRADDEARLKAIMDAVDDRVRVDLIASYWHDDIDRAQRAPRELFYLHIGMCCGIIHRLLGVDRGEDR